MHAIAIDLNHRRFPVKIIKFCDEYAFYIDPKTGKTKMASLPIIEDEYTVFTCSETLYDIYISNSAYSN